MTDFNLVDVWVAARELNEGNNKPNAKFALQIAACSAQQSLSNNGLIARVLAKYVTNGLPDRETLYQELLEEKVMINDNHLSAVYHAEELDKAGLLAPLYNCPEDLVGQRAWRTYVHDLFHPTDSNGKSKGMGMGWKTISFAFLILYPEKCQLAIIDRHHLARLGKKQVSLGYHVAYYRVEDEMVAERDQYVACLNASTDLVPLGVWGWYKWESYRQEKGVSEASDGEIESHLMLSCRWYN